MCVQRVVRLHIGAAGDWLCGDSACHHETVAALRGKGAPRLFGAELETATDARATPLKARL